MRFLLLEMDTELQKATEILYKREAGMKARQAALLTYLEKRGMQNVLVILRNKKSGYEELLNSIFVAIDAGEVAAQKYELVLKKLKIEKVKPEYFSNFIKVAHMISNSDIRIDSSASYLFDPSLYNRREYDFEYTMRVFMAATDPTLCRKTFGTDKFDIKKLYDGNVIRPAGAAVKDTSENTIHGIILKLTGGSSSSSSNPYAKSTKRSSSKFSTYKSLEDVDKSEAKEGNIIHIDGDYKFKNGKWVPVEVDI